MHGYIRGEEAAPLADFRVNHGAIVTRFLLAAASVIAYTSAHGEVTMTPFDAKQRF
jgi:hypothetical protein